MPYCTVQCGAVQIFVVQYSAVQYSETPVRFTVKCITHLTVEEGASAKFLFQNEILLTLLVQCSEVKCSSVQCNSVHCSEGLSVQCNAVQYTAVQCNLY